ncbi:hypothetical protein E2C01_073021 [Portunus trituberculatus]|uniref:Uncharacterized protein n=1 Tax=Portunus trituberculatus TaxID=210409 RepID=A0A5B7HZM9_PORTR|nr:hypothetical protein [Portunus trituberculatus]
MVHKGYLSTTVGHSHTRGAKGHLDQPPSLTHVIDQPPCRSDHRLLLLLLSLSLRLWQGARCPPSLPRHRASRETRACSRHVPFTVLTHNTSTAGKDTTGPGTGPRHCPLSPGLAEGQAHLAPHGASRRWMECLRHARHTHGTAHLGLLCTGYCCHTMALSVTPQDSIKLA